MVMTNPIKRLELCGLRLSNGAVCVSQTETELLWTEGKKKKSKQRNKTELWCRLRLVWLQTCLTSVQLTRHVIKTAQFMVHFCQYGLIYNNFP